MTLKGILCASACLMALTAAADAETTLTIATVNNGDMVRMQTLTDDFTTKNPDIKLQWVTLEENVLRERVTTDIATKGGQFDVLTIGTYEVPIWAKQGWLVPLDNLGADYDVDDILPPEAAGLTMPESPTWEFVADAAKKITDKSKEVYGICLRGKAGWGENMAFLSATANSFGARWFDESWKPQFDQPAWKETLDFYVKMLNESGPPGASSNGFNENLALFNSGKCGMWIDATVAASFVTNPKDSSVADKVGFALAPNTGKGKNANWLWAWSLAVPAGSQKVEAAEKFIGWATSKGYTELVASKEGWANVPPGTRKSLYANPEYTAKAPFAALTLASIESADPTKPTVDPVPYTGVQFVAIPEFQGLGTTVGQYFSAALAGSTTVDEALAQAQATATDVMTEAGYIQ